MSNPKQILALERFDSYLEPEELLNNIKKLAEYLSKQNPPVDQIKDTMSYLIETKELMKSNDDNIKLQLAICFVHAYRISSSTNDEQPIKLEDEEYIDRLFELLNDVFSKWGKSTDYQEEIVSLIQITNRIGLYRLAAGCGLDGEIFSTLIKIDMPESVDNIAILINHSDRIPSKILSGMCDLITKNKNVELLLLKIPERQVEFVQGISSNFSDSSGVECVQVYEKVASILKMPPSDLFDYIQNDINIENEDDQTRYAAVELLTKEFSEAPFDPSDHECISMLISRNEDKFTKIRVITVKFGFEELLKINEYKKNIKQNANQNDEDVVKSVIKKIENEVWDMALDRINDKYSNEVRSAALKAISHLDAKDIKLDEKEISSRLKDKSPEVREIALRVMLKLYDAKPDKHEWLIDQVIELYKFSKDIALYGFSKLMSNHSLIEVASNITNRKPLLDILKDTNELRLNLPEIKNSEESREIVSKHADVKKISKLLKKVPKTFFEQAVDYKKRKQLSKKLKEKIGSDSHLLLGLYQPCPLDVDDLLACKDLDVVHDLGKVFTYQLEEEIPNLIKRCNKTDLTILATFKNYELDDDDRQKILKALIPQITSKKRNLALIAFAHIYRKNKANDQLLSKIKFDKKDFIDKITFYGHFVDSRAYPESIYDDIDKNVDLIDEDTVKYALKIAITESAQRSIDILMHFRELYPDVSFKYYLMAAQNRECYSHITPEVFRQFAYVMQCAKSIEIRANAIKYLTIALSSNLTPIHFLALYALSATDPVSYNQKEAKQQLEKAVKFRRNLMKQTDEFISQITPETAIPYLVNILAHHKDFEADLPELATFSLYLEFFLTPICATTNQFSYIIELCTYYSFLDDVEEDYTDNNKKLFNLAIAIVKDIGQGKTWAKNPIKTDFGHSERYYKEPQDKHKLREALRHSGDNLKSPMRPKAILRAGMTSSTPKRSKLPDVDSDESESESKRRKGKKTSSKAIKSAPATPKRKSSAQSTKSTRKSSVSISALSTPKRASTKSKKKVEIDNSDNDNDEESTSTKLKSPKKKRAASAANSPTASPRKATKVTTNKKSSAKPSAKSSAKSSAKPSAKSSAKPSARSSAKPSAKNSAKSSAASTPKRKQTKPPAKTKNAKK